MPERLTIDVNLAMAGGVGPAGLPRGELEALAPRVEAAHRAFQEARAAKRVSFPDLPGDREAASRAAEAGAWVRGSFDDLLVLGIGGSSLGAKALFSALCHPFHNLLPRKDRPGVRVFFPDNADPSTFSGLLDVVNLERAAIAAITKSGGTAETWAQLLVVIDRLRRSARGDQWREQLIAITDPERGALRSVARAEGLRTLDVPPSVGGRFSVLSAVGLLPAAAAGIDVEALLSGARAMVQRCERPNLFENPAWLLASCLYLFETAHARPVHVFMPYADGLRETADWFVQLWAESLGKKLGDRSVGPTPVRAVGATDQHSLLQLLMEGPPDKVIVFGQVARPRQDLEIPSGLYDAEPDVAYLGGHRMGELLAVEQEATRAALAAGGRPSITLSIPSLDPRSLGELLMLWELTTAFAGALHGVDPYDQPGVEAGKRYACGILGRPGYEKFKQELAGRPAPREEWVR